ncbi:MAG: mucoidy inhibitor MuiA family protein [Myxococcales bacterium]|nr:mucoidy inhibitor MuiA family protein [Myxococcales bacterium]
MRPIAALRCDAGCAGESLSRPAARHGSSCSTGSRSRRGASSWEAIAVNETSNVLASEATTVTLFEDRAEVVRRARGGVPAGVSWLAISGVSAVIDDPSLVTRVDGQAGEAGARVIAARVVRRVRVEPAAAEGEIDAAEVDLKAACRRAREAELTLARASSDEERSSDLAERLAEGLLGTPRGGEAIARWRAAHHSLDGAHTRALDGAAAAKAELEEARLDLARAELRRTEARAVHPRHEALVEVQIEAPAAGPVAIELTYRTPCALWRPEHLARLVPHSDGNGHDLVLLTLATAWQRTGEDWSGIACRFSTARPAHAASPPLLTDDLLTTRKKSDAERRTVAVDAREQSIALTGVAGGARAVDEMPGVEDGGEPLWFDAPGPVTLPSDGRPLRVELGEVTLPCQVGLFAWPELGEAAHLRATALLTSSTASAELSRREPRLTGDGPLLAGPVRVARGGALCGRGKVGFIGQGEPLELGFGVDDGIRIRRRVDEKRDTTPVIGTQKITRTVKLYLGNLSGVAKRVTVVERVPVSEIGEVTIELIAAGGARLDRDGFARFEVELQPRETRELSLQYRIEAAARVQLAL